MLETGHTWTDVDSGLPGPPTDSQKIADFFSYSNSLSISNMLNHFDNGNTAIVIPKIANAHITVAWFQDLIWIQKIRFEKKAKDKKIANPYY